MESSFGCFVVVVVVADGTFPFHFLLLDAIMTNRIRRKKRYLQEIDEDVM